MYKNLIAMSSDIIQRYFREVTDENAKFDPYKINLRTYINEELGKINLY